MTTRLAAADLAERREVLPGRWLLAFHAPDIANGARAGQFVHVRTEDDAGLTRRRPYPLHSAEARTGVASILVRDTGRPTRPLLAARPGDALDLLGPLGRPFEVDPRTQHLLLVASGDGIAGVRLLADEAVRDGRQVTLLYGATGSREVYPSNLLPDEVEYLVATEDGSLGHHGAVTDLVADYEAWADQAFASGPPTLLAALTAQAIGRRDRLGVAKLGRRRGGGKVDPVGSPAARRKSFLQVAVEQTVGCALATCLGCVVAGVNGVPQRVCREGPVFAADELAWDGVSA